MRLVYVAIVAVAGILLLRLPSYAEVCAISTTGECAMTMCDVASVERLVAAAWKAFVLKRHTESTLNADSSW